MWEEAVDIAERDVAGLDVWDLHAHGGLAGDRCEDAHFGGGQGVLEIVLEVGDFADLDPGLELQFVSRHPRTGDRADHLRRDVEALQGRDETFGDVGHGFGGLALVVRETPQDGRIGQLPVSLLRRGEGEYGVCVARSFALDCGQRELSCVVVAVGGHVLRLVGQRRRLPEDLRGRARSVDEVCRGRART